MICESYLTKGVRGDSCGLMQLNPAGLQHTSALSHEDAFIHQLPAVITWGVIPRAFAPYYFGLPCMGWADSYSRELQVLKRMRFHGSVVRHRWGPLCFQCTSPGTHQPRGSIQEQLSTFHGTQCQQWVLRPVLSFPRLWTFLFFRNTSWKPRQIRILWTSLPLKIVLVAKLNSGFHGGSYCFD